ncbi:hypothetical protein QR77_29290 [Streptomyces sp. 150FB]|uniref:DUF6069 family protein n=1 Tax=Streptomyces sp. 150FB TaxID=1576605 RepID=UPI000588F97C|nr:DUF6069 family protein [Streptomyces sp. 150FB]KIF76844.1 hypothetical protein QR77_29290 [Streptomyces sp. 150FB]
MSTTLNRFLTVVGAVVGTAVVWLIAHQAVSGPLKAKLGSGDAEPQEITIALVIVITAVVGLVAWGLLALLERSAKGRTAWIWIAVVVFVLSLLGPLGSAEGTGAKISLALMHVVTAAVLIPGLTRTRTGQNA